MNRLDILTELSGLDPGLLAEAEEYKPEVLAAARKKKYIYIATAIAASLVLLFGLVVLKQNGKKEKPNSNAISESNGNTAAVSPDESVVTESIIDVKRTVYYCDGQFSYYKRFGPDMTSNMAYFDNYEGGDLAKALHIDMNIPVVKSGLYTADEWSKNWYAYHSENGGKIFITLFSQEVTRNEKFADLETNYSVIRGREVEIIKKEDDRAPEYAAYFYMGNHSVSLELSGEKNEDILLETLDYLITQAEIHERDFNEPSHIKDAIEEKYIINLNVVKK